MEEKIAIQYAKCKTIIEKNHDRILKKEQIDRFDVIFSLLNNLVEETFTHYLFQFFLKNDFFHLIHKTFLIYHNCWPPSTVKLLTLTQLIVSNTHSSNDLNEMIKLSGFQQFFQANFQFEKHEESSDYYANIVKFIVLKVDSNTNFAWIQPMVKKTLLLNCSKDNLLKTTMHNIVLSILSVNNPTFESFVNDLSFKCFYFDILRDIGKKFVEIDNFILKNSIKEVQNLISDLQENLQFIDELSHIVISEETLCFMFNSFILAVAVHLILPTFRADIKIKNKKTFGINAVLFLTDLILHEIKNEALNFTFAVDVIMKDKIHVIAEEFLDFNIIHGSDYGLLSKSIFFQKPREIAIFETRTENFVAVSQIKRPIGLIKTIPQSQNPKIVSCDSLIPSLDKNATSNHILISSCTGKVFQTLWAFFRSKDDNMLLITSNILIFIFVNYFIAIDQDVEKVTEKMFELLESDYGLRYITSKNVCQLIFILYDHLSNVGSFSVNINRLFSAKVKKMKFYLENPRTADYLVIKMQKVACETEEKENPDEYQTIRLNWLSLVNYVFTTSESTVFDNIDPKYKRDLSEEEQIEVEIKMLVSIRMLRNFINKQHNLPESCNSISKISGRESDLAKLIEFVEDGKIHLDFQNRSDLKVLFPAKIGNYNKSNVLLISIGKYFVLIEELPDQKNTYSVLFREFFANVIFYISKANDKHLIVKIRNKSFFWTLVFVSVQSAVQSMKQVDDLWKVLKNQETKLIQELMSKFEGEVKTQTTKSYKIEF